MSPCLACLQQLTALGSARIPRPFVISNRPERGKMSIPLGVVSVLAGLMPSLFYFIGAMFGFDHFVCQYTPQFQRQALKPFTQNVRRRCLK